jgi:hypothetical protein
MPIHDKPTLTTTQAARLLDLHPATIASLCDRGIMHAERATPRSARRIAPAEVARLAAVYVERRAARAARRARSRTPDARADQERPDLLRESAPVTCRTITVATPKRTEP